MLKSGNPKSYRLAVRAGCAVALAGIFVGLAPSAVQAEEKKFLIGIVELQLANPFFGKLEKSAVDTAKKHGLDVMTAEANTAGDFGDPDRSDREHDQSRREGHHT